MNQPYQPKKINIGNYEFSIDIDNAHTYCSGGCINEPQLNPFIETQLRDKNIISESGLRIALQAAISEYKKK